jgi:exodeoxyribonuclease V alpha subunit
VLLAAPTGRAAKRLSEATGREARTVHRLLEFDPVSRGFLRGPERPLPAEVVIVDESSMLDVSLAHHVARAVPEGGRLILVGDVDQLPSVGPGRVLAELIDSGAVDVVRLTEIYRQAGASRIVVNAHRVNRGEMPILAGAEAAGGDFFYLDRRTPEEVLDTVLHLVAERIPAGFGFDPLADVQVLTPMNRGLLGTASLNEHLRQRLNPPRPGTLEMARGGRLFRVGDKVMQVRNNYELEVFNGDLGRVVGIDGEEQEMVVDFDGRAVAYDVSLLDELVPAFACSIHKSQGSEYPCVVVPLHSQHYVMLERNLLYTALTRARKLVVIVGEPRALAVAVGNRRTRERYTRLAERLRAG